MLVLILAQAVTGLFANDEIASAGPFYGWVSHELSNRLSRFHRANDNWLLVLIGLHLAAVAWYASYAPANRSRNDHRRSGDHRLR